MVVASPTRIKTYVACRAVGIGIPMKKAIQDSDLEELDRISRNLSAARDQSTNIATSEGGRLHACPSYGGSSYFATFTVEESSMPRDFLPRIKDTFNRRIGDSRIRVRAGMASSLLGAAENCEMDEYQIASLRAWALDPRTGYGDHASQVEVLTVDGNDIGSGMRDAINSNNIDVLDEYSARISAGMKELLRIVGQEYRGTIYAPGGDNFSAVVNVNTVDATRLKNAFRSQTGGKTLAVGVGADLYESYVKMNEDKSRTSTSFEERTLARLRPVLLGELYEFDTRFL